MNENDPQQFQDEQSVYADTAMQKPKKKKSALLIIILIVLFVIIAGTAAIVAGVFKAFKSTEYTLSGETVASYFEVTQKIPNNISVDASGSEVLIQNSFNYSDSDKLYEDLSDYIDYLMNNECFYLLTDIEPGSTSGTMDFAKNSTDDGKIIRISITYDSETIDIDVHKYEDVLTVY